MNVQHRNVAIILGMLVFSLAGCNGEPRVTVITSTMVGLEAKPPMGDAQPNPSVSLAYKRAEMVLIPVCQVTEYDWSKEAKGQARANGTQTPSKHEPQASTPQVQQEQTKEAQASVAKCPPKSSAEVDAYAITGRFQMQHNWFGPLNIKQFIATGMAARHLSNPVAPKVNVTGEVKKPGQYPFKKDLKVEEAIELAGGKTDNASDGQVKLLREGTEVSIKDTDPLSANDTLRVLAQEWFTITGEVKNPDRYLMSGQLTGGEAIHKAGGYAQKADKDKSSLRRRINGQDVTLTEIENVTVLPNDLIIIPSKSEETPPNRSAEHQAIETFSIGGAVKKPGSYPHSKGLTVRRAIEMAGGQTDIAKTGSVKISRVMDDQNHTDIAPDHAPVLPNDILFVETGKASQETDKGSCMSPCRP